MKVHWEGGVVDGVRFGNDAETHCLKGFFCCTPFNLEQQLQPRPAHNTNTASGQIPSVGA